MGNGGERRKCGRKRAAVSPAPGDHPHETGRRVGLARGAIMAGAKPAAGIAALIVGFAPS